MTEGEVVVMCFGFVIGLLFGVLAAEWANRKYKTQ